MESFTHINVPSECNEKANNNANFKRKDKNNRERINNGMRIASNDYKTIVCDIADLNKMSNLSCTLYLYIELGSRYTTISRIEILAK